MVVSQNFSSATSLAMFAPMRTVMVMPRFPLMTSEMSLRPSGPASTPYSKQTKNDSWVVWTFVRFIQCDLINIGDQSLMFDYKVRF